MRASIKWLKDYVEFNQSPEKLADMMTMAGVPAENIEYLGQGIENVITGKIMEVAPHPNADKLSVCKVNIGDIKLTIITGATNISQGDIVPVAMVGAKLPSGMEIGVADFRGIDSHGMLCSADELNMDSKILSPEARNGIYILPPDTPIGTDIRKVLGLDDVVLEFELTPNRADCFSVLGLAREVSVLTEGRLKKPMLNVREEVNSRTTSLAKVTIEAKDLCSRFTARILQDIKIGPSPLWMQQRIQAAGMRPISNVVDVTNFVMLELGVPMHAYDYNFLAEHSIVVRRANPGERLTTLDGVKRELTSDMLVIADAVQAVGIAGVMGGLATEVTSATRTVLLEAAAFNGASVRRTSRALGLRSEASGRFERGIDPAAVEQALDRAASLLEEMGACKTCQGIIDMYPGVQLPRQIAFNPEEISARLGVEIPQFMITNILRRLEFEVESKPGTVSVTVPSWRGDVTGSADISEEIARIYGYDNIPTTLPYGEVVQGRQSYKETIAAQTRESLSSIGFSEIITFSFIHPTAFDKLSVANDDPLRQAIPLLNPITEEFPLLKTTLMAGVLDTVVRNLARKNDTLRIYELGAVYRAKGFPIVELPSEPLMVCGAICGKRQEESWNQPRETVDFYDAKGAVEVVLEKMGISDYSVIAGEYLAMHPGKTALFVKNGEVLGAAGEVHPKVLAAFGISRPVYLFELDHAMLEKYAVTVGEYHSLPKFPAVERDLAVILPQTVFAADVTNAIIASGGELLTEVRLFDVYSGEQVPEGSKSMAFSLTFRAADRTLTDDEVDGYYNNIVARLENSLTAKMRV
ncbi:MAG: pheT [Firmicutes bacterium]|nr:pheT [Bacillota bacterium]